MSEKHVEPINHYVFVSLVLTSVLQVHEASTRGVSVQLCGSWVVVLACLMWSFWEEKFGKTLRVFPTKRLRLKTEKFIGSLLCFNGFISVVIREQPNCAYIPNG